MNVIEEAIIYATVMHQGKIRKMRGTPYILHPLEVAHIVSTMTNDEQVIAAGVLHDIVEDTDGTLEEIRSRFGDRVAELVESETEYKYPGVDATDSWKRRKEESLKVLATTSDVGIKILWLADKLSNIRSFQTAFSEKGDDMWQYFHMTDPQMQRWYYSQVAEYVELDLNRTGAFKEFIQHINFIWPGTFATEKMKYKKYREYSVEGCKVIGKGAKGTVYKYDDELIIKVYNEKNTYKDIERENYLARQAFVAGIPTAISFGIVKVGEQYGAVFELLNSSSVSTLISQHPNDVKYYADLMADLALKIHSTVPSGIDLPDFTYKAYEWVDKGISVVDKDLASAVRKLIDELPPPETMIHGDFHTGNVMIQNDEPLIIDMDRISVCHPIVELSGIHTFYYGYSVTWPKMSEDFMGFSTEVENQFYEEFMKHYLGTDDPEKIKEVCDKAALLSYARILKNVFKKGMNVSDDDAKVRDFCIGQIRELLKTVKTLDFKR